MLGEGYEITFRPPSEPGEPTTWEGCEQPFQLLSPLQHRPEDVGIAVDAAEVQEVVARAFARATRLGILSDCGELRCLEMSHMRRQLRCTASTVRPPDYHGLNTQLRHMSAFEYIVCRSLTVQDLARRQLEMSRLAWRLVSQSLQSRHRTTS